MNKRILVTGGAGFIGSYLCEKLVNKGNYVICCDNFYTGNKNNLVNLLNNKNFELIQHDITFPIYLEVDEIFNFACPASPIHYQNDPVQTIKTCVHGAINMLGLAKRTKAKIIQASTSEIYGDPEIHPQTEEYKGAVSINGPRACYDEGKRCAETLFWDYKRQHLHGAWMRHLWVCSSANRDTNNTEKPTDVSSVQRSTDHSSISRAIHRAWKKLFSQSF